MTEATKPAVYIFDIDGTLALRDGRGPFDWEQVSTDVPNQPIIDIALALNRLGERLVFVSGRPEDTRPATELWLQQHLGVHAPLFMRPSRDFRSDVEIKREIFHREIAQTFRVKAVFDDRDRVVALWRHELGLTCLQVAPGDF